MKMISKLSRSDKKEVEELNLDLNRLIAKLDPAFNVKLDRRVKKALEKDLRSFWLKKDRSLVVAKEGKEVVGFVAYRIERMEDYFKYQKKISLNLLFVKEEWRKKNIGKRLIREVRNRAKKEKIKWIDISTDVTNTRALKIYKKSGFKPRYTTLSIIK